MHISSTTFVWRQVVQIERTLVAPNVFGEQFVLFDRPAARSALTLTFCEVAILQRVNFIRALRMFPECMEPVRVRQSVSTPPRLSRKFIYFFFCLCFAFARRCVLPGQIFAIKHMWLGFFRALRTASYSELVAIRNDWEASKDSNLPSRAPSFYVPRSSSSPLPRPVSGTRRGKVARSLEQQFYNINNPLVTQVAASRAAKQQADD